MAPYMGLRRPTYNPLGEAYQSLAAAPNELLLLPIAFQACSHPPPPSNAHPGSESSGPIAWPPTHPKRASQVEELGPVAARPWLMMSGGGGTSTGSPISLRGIPGAHLFGWTARGCCWWPPPPPRCSRRESSARAVAPARSLSAVLLVRVLYIHTYIHTCIQYNSTL